MDHVNIRPCERSLQFPETHGSVLAKTTPQSIGRTTRLATENIADLPTPAEGCFKSPGTFTDSRSEHRQLVAGQARCTSLTNGIGRWQHPGMHHGPSQLRRCYSSLKLPCSNRQQQTMARQRTMGQVIDRG